MRTLILVMALLVAGCRVPQAERVIYRTNTTEIWRDSMVYVSLPASSSVAVIPNSDTSKLTTDLAKSEAWVMDGLLHHTLTDKEQKVAVEVRWRDRIITRDSIATREISVEVEKKLTTFQKLKLEVGGWLLALLGVLAGYYIFKMVSRVK